MATLMPVSNIMSGMTYFASDLGTVVNPVFAGVASPSADAVRPVSETSYREVYV